MPNNPSVTGIPKSLPLNEWVVMEEIVTAFVAFWTDQDRHIDVPPGVRVKLKHEMSAPPFYWEVTLGKDCTAFSSMRGGTSLWQWH